MKKILFVLLAVAFTLSLGISNLALAQEIDIPEDAIVIATVNIYEAKIISQEGNTFNLSFDISNREGAQGQVKYGIQLLEEIDGGGQVLVDEKVYSEEINLAENTTIHKEIIYEAPQYLDGKYQLWIISKNTSGLSLALNMAGDIELTNTEEYIEILDNSCFLQVEGEKDSPKYYLYQGIDITPEETLKMTCDVVSHFNSDISFIPIFQTLRRSQFGDEVAHTEIQTQALTLEADEQKSISFFLPKAQEPQAYDLNVILKDSQENDISNTVFVHYVLTGASATIQNLTFDKDFYKKGDIARISFFGTLAADSFAEARAEQFTKMEDIVTIIQITDENGEACSQDIIRPLTSDDTVYELQTKITKDCFSPVASVFIKDKNGEILDSSSFAITSGEQEEESTSVSMLIIILIIFAVIVLFVWLKKRKIQNFNPVAMLLLSLVVFSGVFLVALPEARADTFFVEVSDSTPGHPHTNKTMVTVNLNKNNYNPGEQIVAFATTKTAVCINLGANVFVTAGYNNNRITLIHNSFSAVYAYSCSTCTQVTFNGTGVFTAPTVAAGYNMNFQGNVTLYHIIYGYVGSGSASYNMPFSISPPAPPRFTLTTTKTGSGTVTGSGISCGSDCSQSYNYGTSVTLNASPSSGWGFTGWSGSGCSGTGKCKVSMTASRSVKATFSITSRTLNVSKTGSGTVTGSGISCGSDCSQSYNYGTSVTLTASPSSGWGFTGWSGSGCSGTGKCKVSMTASRSVKAKFSITSRTLNVSKTGSGTVTGSGISCGSDCSQSYNYGTSVTLNASPSSGWGFTGWSGSGCSGTGKCKVSMTASRSVKATFSITSRTLNVSKTGSGTGMITSLPSGISCGSDCSQSYNYGTSVILTSTPQAGSSFTGWSGACGGAGSCNLSMTASRNVTATFINILPTVNLSANPTAIDYGANSTLTWTSSNATSCIASIAWSGSKALSGSENTGSLTLDKVYRLTCSGAGGSAEDMTTVFVAQPAQCEDGIDNNGNGLSDVNDPGCWSDYTDSNTYDPNDDDEGNFECSDGIDNDGDGQIDYPNDTSCLSATGAGGSDESIPVCGNTVCETGENPSNCSIDCTLKFEEF